jgi:hypothetical protein
VKADQKLISHFSFVICHSGLTSSGGLHFQIVSSMRNDK